MDMQLIKPIKPIKTKEQIIEHIKNIIEGATEETVGYGTGYVIDKDDALVMQIILNEYIKNGKECDNK